MGRNNFQYQDDFFTVWTDWKFFIFERFFDSEPSEDNIDDMEAVISEIHADLPFQTDNGAEMYF